jgi:hypothetical protein
MFRYLFLAFTHNHNYMQNQSGVHLNNFSTALKTKNKTIILIAQKFSLRHNHDQF